MRRGSRRWSAQKLRPPRLSQPALETLAIIAYRQPITRAEVEQIRGVNVDGMMQTLMERGLVEQSAARRSWAGRTTYGTTALFLEYFGLRGLEDLPAADELRRIPVEKPPAPVTADPGLATTPPEQLALGKCGKESGRNAGATGNWRIVNLFRGRDAALRRPDGSASRPYLSLVGRVTPCAPFSEIVAGKGLPALPRSGLRSDSVVRKKRAWFTKNKSCWKQMATGRCTT